MSSLNSIMSIATGSLQAEQGALAVTTNNIANSDTPGYTREVVNLTESQPVSEGNLQMGNGVTLQGFQSVRDEVLQSQIDNQMQQANYSQAQSNALQQAETSFSSTTSGIGADMTSFFNSISQLTTNPSDSSLRQTVLNNAGNLVNDFHAASSSLSQLQTGLDQTVPKSVTEINQLSTQIADLNQQIASRQLEGQDPGTIEDQRDQLVSQLSQLTNLQTSSSSGGETITTGNGTPLVIGNQSFALSTTTGSNGLQEVMQNGQDITSSLTGGSLGGTLEVRDSTLPALQSKLDNLASQFSSAVNTANQSGFDSTGAAGRAFFTTAGTTGAAASIQLALTSPSQIAASSDGTAGSGGNLSNLLAVQNAELPSGMTPLDAYSDLVYTVGNASSQAQANNTAANAALSQLQTQQSSVSGVSMDEETTNMMQYQQTYQAAAKVVSTVDSLYSILISMGLTTA
jgi:flagellar hook-associated protein 1 FlgK